MLLLGYAVEMYLKAGLAKAYRGCSDGMFDRDVTRFGHDYKRIAAAIEFPGLPQDDEYFELLRLACCNRRGRVPNQSHGWSPVAAHRVQVQHRTDQLQAGHTRGTSQRGEW